MRVFLSELQHANSSSTFSGLANESKAFVHTTQARQLNIASSSVNLPAIVATKSSKLRAWNKPPLTEKWARVGARWDGSLTSIYMTTPCYQHRPRQTELQRQPTSTPFWRLEPGETYIMTGPTILIDFPSWGSVMSSSNKKCVNTFYTTRSPDSSVGTVASPQVYKSPVPGRPRDWIC